MTDMCLSALPGSLSSGGSSQSPIQTKPLIPQKVLSRWTCNCHQGAALAARSVLGTPWGPTPLSHENTTSGKQLHEMKDPLFGVTFPPHSHGKLAHRGGNLWRPL